MSLSFPTRSIGAEAVGSRCPRRQQLTNHYLRHSSTRSIRDLRDIQELHQKMDRVPNWVWWTIAGGILLSPVFAFLLAVVVEISIGVLMQGGVPALLVVAAALMSGRLLFYKHRTRARADNLLGDQA
jgi:hypothetical protein